MIDFLEYFLSKYWEQMFYAAMLFVVSKTANYLIQQVATILSRQEAIETRMEKMERSQGVIIYDRFFQACRHFMARNWVTPSDLVNLDHLYQEYHAHDFNGAGTELYKRCLKLKLMDETHVEDNGCWTK